MRETDDRERKPIAPLSSPSAAWECVTAKLCFASPPSLPIPDSFPRLRFAKQSLGTTKKALVWPEEEYRRYSSLWHGVGLCDEYPSVCFPSSWAEGGNNGELLAGMVVCAESYVGRKDGGEGVKFEEQVLITEEGPEVLSVFP